MADHALPCPTPGDDVLVAHWPDSGPVKDNWGDKLNPVLIARLSGKRVVCHSRLASWDGPVHVVIGSSLHWSAGRAVIWGTGFISADKHRKRRPERICAVRGPHSRAKLLADGLDCPEIYGDPALLYPLFYNPVVEPRFDLGIIQHFREAGLEPLPEVPAGMAVRIIDITGGIDEVVDAILSCRHIASSSLHGLIAAHAYGIPATWLRFSDRLLGDGFKFRDYWASLGWDDAVPIEVAAGTPCAALFGTPRPLRPRVDLKRLLQACPFIDDQRQAELCALLETRSGLAALAARSG